MKMRTKKLVRRDVQQSLLVLHVSVTLMALSFQFLAFLYAMMGRSSESAGLETLNGEVLSGLTQAFLLTAVIVLPATVIAAILTSHRIAGPIYRFRGFLEAVSQGKSPEDIRLRKGDKLQDVAELLNQVTRPLRTVEQDGTEVERAA